MGWTGRLALTHRRSTCKVDSWQEAAAQRGELSSVLCDDLEAWGGGGREAPEGEDICTHF